MNANKDAYTSRGREIQQAMANVSLNPKDFPMSDPPWSSSRTNDLEQSPDVKIARTLEDDWQSYRDQSKKKLVSPLKSRKVTQDLEETRVELEARREEALRFLQSPDNRDRDAGALSQILRNIDTVNGKLAKDPNLRKMYERVDAIAALPFCERAFAQVDSRNWAIADQGADLERSMEQLMENWQKYGPDGESPSLEEVDQLREALSELGRRHKTLRVDRQTQLEAMKQWEGVGVTGDMHMEALDELDLALQRIEKVLCRIQLPAASKKGKSKQPAAPQPNMVRRLSLLLSPRLQKDKAIEEDRVADLEADTNRLLAKCSNWHDAWRELVTQSIHAGDELISVSGHRLETKLQDERKALEFAVGRLETTLLRERGLVASQRLVYRASDFLLENWTDHRRASFDTGGLESISRPDKPSADELVVLRAVRREYTLATMVNLLCNEDHLALPSLMIQAKVFIDKLHNNPALQGHNRRVARYPTRLFKIQDLANSETEALDFQIKRLVCGSPGHRRESIGRTPAPHKDPANILKIARLMMTQSVLVEKLGLALGLEEADTSISTKQESIRAKQSIPVDGYGRAYAKELLDGLSFEYPDSDFTV